MPEGGLPARDGKGAAGMEGLKRMIRSFMIPKGNIPPPELKLPL